MISLNELIFTAHEAGVEKLELHIGDLIKSPLPELDILEIVVKVEDKSAEVSVMTKRSAVSASELPFFQYHADHVGGCCGGTWHATSGGKK